MSKDLYGFPDQPIKGWSPLSRALGVMSVVFLVGLTLLTCVDVVARYMFNAPINGAFELTQLMLAALIFVALPLTTAARQHIEVDLLAGFMSKGMDKITSLFAGLASCAVLLVLSWRLAHHSIKLAQDGAVTNSLALPLDPIGYLASLSCLVSAGLVLAISLNGMRKD
ncbi:MAG: TRAP transporter small permease [Cohaesibacter sp.]|jgi:TRAP-type C4-dicarboxylate transport system permease small subunit|nr:TRAP transporter small permease [Cohaesibacter sp.]